MIKYKLLVIGTTVYFKERNKVVTFDISVPFTSEMIATPLHPIIFLKCILYTFGDHVCTDMTRHQRVPLCYCRLSVMSP